MTTQGTNFTGADYNRGSNWEFTDPRWVEFIPEGSRGGYAIHYGNSGRIAYMFPANWVAELEMKAYQTYVKACNDEELTAHDLHMWRVHGNPTGPL